MISYASSGSSSSFLIPPQLMNSRSQHGPQDAIATMVKSEKKWSQIRLGNYRKSVKLNLDCSGALSRSIFFVAGSTTTGQPRDCSCAGTNRPSSISHSLSHFVLLKSSWWAPKKGIIAFLFQQSPTSLLLSVSSVDGEQQHNEWRKINKLRLKWNDSHFDRSRIDY